MTNKITIASIALGVLATVAVFLGVLAIISRPTTAEGLGIQNTPSLFFYVASSSSMTVGNMGSTNASSTTVLPESTGRTWALLSNNSQYPIFCNYMGMLGTSTYPAQLPTASTGFIIAASSTWTIGLPNAIYTGAVNCATQGGTSTVYVEVNQ